MMRRRGGRREEGEGGGGGQYSCLCDRAKTLMAVVEGVSEAAAIDSGASILFSY